LNDQRWLDSAFILHPFPLPLPDAIVTFVCMMTRMLLTTTTAMLLAATAAVTAEPEPTWAPVTFKNLCEIHMVTSGPNPSNHGYPTCRTWSRDGHLLFVETTRRDPPSEGKMLGRIRAINIETGQSEDLTPEGIGGSYGFDYAPAGECIVCQDAAGKKLRLLNLRTGKMGVIAEEPDGTICGPPSIATDGTRVAYWAMLPSTENRFFDNYTTVILAVDVDPAECRPLGQPRIVEAYPRRKGPTWTKDHTRDAVHVNHPQINPVNKDHVIYSHEMLGSKPDGTIARCRLWQSMIDESEKRPLVRQPAGLDFTHEVIAPDGKSLIFPYMLGVGQVFFETGKVRSIFYNPHGCPGHLTVSPDMKWIAGDTWGPWTDSAGRAVQSIMMLDVATRRCAHLCWIPRSKGHPGHPHPSFSPDGAKIAFSMLDNKGVCQVAYIDVRDVQRDWARVAQGQGTLASPDWIKGVPASNPMAQ
jgi:hypothetical protein